MLLLLWSFTANLHKRIVVKTMGWRWGLLFSPGHVVPPEKVHKSLFVGSQRKFAKPKNPAVARYNQSRTAEQVEKMTERLVRKEWKLRKRLAAHGIHYDFPGFVRWNLIFSQIHVVQHVLVVNICALCVAPGCTGASEEEEGLRGYIYV